MLLSNFNLLATAPGGVARLRELILTLAVQGKLVPQDAADEPAAVLLGKIRVEKDRLIATGKIKREKPLAGISEEEMPFDVPHNWVWVRIGEIAEMLNGYAFKSEWFKPSGIRLLRNLNVAHGTVDWTQSVFIDESRNAECQQFSLHEGDIVLSLDRPIISTGLKFAVIKPVDLPCFLLQRVARLAPKPTLISRDFLVLWLKSNLFVGTIDPGRSNGVPHISTKQVSELITGLPPLPEQSRIVTRVEELMHLCDALETKGKLEAAQHAQLVSSLLTTLTDSETPEALAANWQRISQHFDLLLDRPEAVDALEQIILQLAVRGLLVPQDPQDEPASLLLQKIRAEKDRLIAEGKIRRDKPLAGISGEAKPFELPIGWSWVTLPDLCAISGGATPSKAVASYWVGEIPWVSPKDMKVADIWDAQDHVSEAAVKGSLSLIPTGSLLMVVRGMILDHSFPTAQTRVPVTINQDMKALTPFRLELLPFLALVCHGMKSEILGLIERSTHGTCKLESSKIFGLPIPLPPLPEQSRIVTQVNTLRRLCADLRQRLAASQTAQAQLAAALLEAPAA